MLRRIAPLARIDLKPKSKVSDSSLPNLNGTEVLARPGLNPPGLAAVAKLKYIMMSSLKSCCKAILYARKSSDWIPYLAPVLLSLS